MPVAPISSSVSDNPLLLTTAIEIVVRAGEMMLERFGDHGRVGKKGAIDLVTDVDLAIERMFRERMAERRSMWDPDTETRAFEATPAAGVTSSTYSDSIPATNSPYAEQPSELPEGLGSETTPARA